ncbi:MAG TPA: glutamate synthase subunit beta [Kofleriaceae bacterium]|jgi:glutamate synthase (NADPH/NADH) small chain|nr:glutamate synthase subunit beta [Kofleriaceae bacterium]
MGKVDGFLTTARAAPHRRVIALRVLDWHEVEHDAEPAATREQAGRCMDCGVPFCTHGCPLGNPIPDFADAVARDDWREAARWLHTTNEFPEFTGRVCPAPCEAACVLAIDGAAVTIESLERAIAERAFAEGWIAPRPPAVRTGKRVAIVGSGPAGLAAAAALNRAGHTVTVFEAAAHAGGLLRIGIPDFKLDKRVVDRRLAIMQAEGIELRCNTRIDDWRELRVRHDAVVIAIGAERPRELDVPGRELAGVVQAMDYLRAQHGVGSAIDARGKRVVILGGGDTGSDCLGTALRQGAASVMQVELMPAPPEQRAATNAWPAWPLVFRTSSSQEEGGERRFAFRTTRFVDDTGRLIALEGVRDDNEPVRIDVDLAILALGFAGADARGSVTQLGVALDGRGNVLVDGAFATTATGVFCAGDAHRGASLVVWAIAEGRDCARALDAHLRAR